MADGGGQVDRWYSAAELAGLPEMPANRTHVQRRASRDHWPSRPRAGRGGGMEYPFHALPHATQAALLLREQPAPVTNATRARSPKWTEARIASAWRRYKQVGKTLKDTAASRLKALHAVSALVRSGLMLTEARATVAAQMQREGVPAASVKSIERWQAATRGAHVSDWLALLVPHYVGRTVTAECDPQCWDWYKGQYLTRERPSHADTYRRVQEMAQAQGWVIPSARTLARRMDRDVEHSTQVLLREGPEAAARLVPTQTLRSTAHFGAGEAVNGDGLKFDRLWVTFEDGETINTATAWFWQDLRTRKLLAWRVGKTENTDLFRLATYDLTAICAPMHVWVDNTRVAANKQMTASAQGRRRHKARPDDGVGLLGMIGAEVHFTNPDHEVASPGAKPIERAFGQGGIHHAVATHPRLVGRGYSKATAIDVAELREVLAEEVARHNAQRKRRTEACRGILSFDDAWAAAVAERAPRVLTDSQRQVLLLAREVVGADKRSGLLVVDAGRGPHGRNAYWCEHLPQYAGQKLAVHYDPANLAAGAHVYGLDGRYLFAAEHRPTGVPFNDTDAAREHAKFKQRGVKAQKKVADAETRMSALERAALYAQATGAEAQPPPKRARGEKVVQGVFQRPVDPARDAARELQRTGTEDSGPSALDLDMWRRAKEARENAI